MKRNMASLTSESVKLRGENVLLRATLRELAALQQSEKGEIGQPSLMGLAGDVGQLPVEQVPEGSTSNSTEDDGAHAPPDGRPERFRCSQIEQAVRKPKPECPADITTAPCTETEQCTGPEVEFQAPCMGVEDNAIQRTEEQDTREEDNKIYPSASGDAVDTIDKMLKFDPTVRTARDEVAKLKELGNAAFKEVKLDAALNFYMMALEREPSDDTDHHAETGCCGWRCERRGCLASTLHTNCAAVFLRMRDFVRAWESAEMALDHDPGNVKALFRGAKAAQALGDVMQAGRLCDRALKLRPLDQGLLALQKDLIAEHADLPESLALAEQLLREAGEYQPAPMD